MDPRSLGYVQILNPTVKEKGQRQTVNVTKQITSLVCQMVVPE